MFPAYSVKPTIEDREGVELILLPGRDKSLPPLYKYICGIHPQRPTTRSNPSTVFVYFIDPSPEGKKLFDQMMDRQKVPAGRTEDLYKFCPGLQTCRPGQSVFARMIGVNGDAKRDILQGYVSRKGTLHSSTQARLVKARDNILGPMSTRTADEIQYERDPRAAKVADDGGRCYHLSHTVQRANSVVAPYARTKVFYEEIDEFLLRRRELLMSSVDACLAGWLTDAPVDLQNTLRRYHEMINSPSVGSEDNYMWGSFQLNVAPAQSFGASASLRSSMGGFGGEHKDSFDSPVALSSMLVLSHLPNEPGWDHGRLHLLALGIYVILEPFTVLYFCGRLMHGGTAPLAPAGVKPPNWAYRMVVIGYPPGLVQQGVIRHALAAIPFTHQTLYVSPEMTGVNTYHPVDRPYTFHANMANEGPLTMNPAGFIKFFARSILLIALAILGQIMRSWNPRIDTEMFLRSISITVDGRTYRGDGWSLAPTGNPHAPRNEAHQAIEEAGIYELYAQRAPSIPMIPNTLERPLMRPKANVGRPDETATQRRAIALADMGLPPKKKKAAQKGTPVKRKKPRTAKQQALLNAASVERKRVRTMKQQALLDAVSDRKRFRSVYVLLSPRHNASSGRDQGERGTSVDELCTTARQHDEQPLRADYLQIRSSSIDADDHNEMEDVINQDESYNELVNLNGTEYEDTSFPTSFDNSPCPSTDIQVLHTGNDNIASGMASTSGLLPFVSPSGQEVEEIESNGVFPLDVAKISQRRAKELGLFLDMLSSSRVGSSLSEVASVMQDGRPYPPGMVNGLVSSIKSIGFGESNTTRLSLEDLAMLGQSTHCMRTYTSTVSACLNICHMRIMVAESYASTYLQELCETQCFNAIQHRAHSPSALSELWIDRLIFDVALQLEAACPIRIKSVDYLSAELVVPSVYNGPSERTKFIVGPVELARATTLHVMRITQQWFHMPIGFLADARALYVRHIVQCYGPGALLLKGVWKIYTDMPWWLYAEDKPIQRKHSAINSPRFKPIHMQPFTTALDNHLDNIAPIKTMLASLAEIYEDLLASMQSNADFPNIHTITLLSLPLPIAQLDSAYTSSQNISALPSNVHLMHTSPGLDVLVSSSPMSVDSQPLSGRLSPSTSSKGTHILLVFLRDALQVSRADYTLPPSLLNSSEAAYLVRQPDFLMPLRHLSPSVIRLRGVGCLGGVNQRFARTEAGLASILIFRGILYNSNAFVRYPKDHLDIRFTTDIDFSAYVSAVKQHFPSQSQDFYCNRSAMFQRPSRFRELSNSTVFFRTVSSSGWEDLFGNSFTISFDCAFKWIHALKRKTSLPDLGDLGLYLVVADMCSIGIVRLPSVEEMSTIIYKLNRGAITGLRLLRYLPTSKCALTPNVTLQAFTAFYDDVTRLLSPSERTDMWWNPITAEHSLCKMSRMYNRHMYTALFSDMHESTSS